MQRTVTTRTSARPDSCLGGKCSFPANFALCDDGNPCTLTDKCSLGNCASGLAKSCDDSNPCSDDSCDLGSGNCLHKANGATCSDGDLCTVKDVCAASSCKGGVPVVCGDGNPCTDDNCGVTTGNCAFVNNTLNCSDGDACTVGDLCAASLCKAGATKPCDDNNPCTTDSCNPASGTCASAANSASCSDGNACTTGDQCSASACKPGTYKNCDDSNVCTTDSCDPKLGVCLNSANTLACSDNNACTVNDGCGGAACLPGAGKVCSDGDACTTDNCDKATGACGFGPIVGCGGNCKSPADCDDANPCTDNACSGGKCAFVNNTAGCSDNNPCTNPDACASGKCQPGPGKNCNDNNPCTTDVCDLGNCVFNNSTAACTDGNACTLTDVCNAGICKPGPLKSCNDNNPCSDDSCNTATGNCVFAANALVCSDGNACTDGDGCKNSACAGGPAKNCSDGNACTADVCSAATGCTYTNLTGACEDGNACTVGDLCTAAACKSGAAKSCDDNTICTSDSCDPASGCVNKAIAQVYKDCAAVFDGKVGSDGVYCIDPDGAGSSAPAQAFCDIGNGGWTLMSHRAKYTEQQSCSLHTDKAVGALSGPKAPTDAKLSDAVIRAFVSPVYRFDGDWTTSPIRHYWMIQQPWSAVWVPQTPSYKCTTSAGDWPVAWTTSPNAYAYPLGNTTCKGATYSTIWFHVGQDACAYIGDPVQWEWRNLGAGSGSEAYVNLWVRSGACKLDGECDDKNPCTTDSCDAAKGTCNYANNTAVCTDNNSCTDSDTCAAGKCVGSAKSCDDSNPCTSDSCAAPAGNCANVANTKNCEDGSACTAADYCSAGACKSGTAKICNDASDCTADSCDAASGACKFAANGNFCPDFGVNGAVFDVSNNGGITVASSYDTTGQVTNKVLVQCFAPDGTPAKPSLVIGTGKGTTISYLQVARSRINGLTFVSWFDMQSWPNPPLEWEDYTAIVDSQCNVVLPQTRLEPGVPKGIIRQADVAASDGDLAAYFYEHQTMGQFRLVFVDKTGVVKAAVDAGAGTCGNGALHRAIAMQRTTGQVVLACEQGAADGGADRFVRRFKTDGSPVDGAWIKVPEAKNSTWHNFNVGMNDNGYFLLAARINSSQIVSFFDSAAGKLTSLNVGTFNTLYDRQITTANGDYVFRLQDAWPRYQQQGSLVASKVAPFAAIRLDAKDVVYRPLGKAIVKEPLGL
ncbi:MAG: hypothetical protein EXR77_15495 [Myxococcales bacterium]|nr:hypothetical protein [Myxococcales bacterium]